MMRRHKTQALIRAEEIPAIYLDDDCNPGDSDTLPAKAVACSIVTDMRSLWSELAGAVDVTTRNVSTTLSIPA